MRRSLAVLAAAVLGLLLLAGPASAHDVLEGSDPAEGSSVATTPGQVTLTFNEAVNPSFATVTVVGPDGGRYEQTGPRVEGERVSAGVNRLGAAGRYEIGYRIVSADGHPVSGAVSFTLTAAQGGAPNGSPQSAVPAAPGAPAAPAASPAASSSPATDEPSSGPPAWVFVVIAVVVVGGALALALRRRT